MTVAPPDKSKCTLKKHEILWNKIRDFKRSKNEKQMIEKQMKIKFNSDGRLPLKKTLELHNMIIFVKIIFSWRQKVQFSI